MKADLTKEVLAATSLVGQSSATPQFRSDANIIDDSDLLIMQLITCQGRVL